METVNARIVICTLLYLFNLAMSLPTKTPAIVMPTASSFMNIVDPFGNFDPENIVSKNPLSECSHLTNEDGTFIAESLNKVYQFYNSMSNSLTALTIAADFHLCTGVDTYKGMCHNLITLGHEMFGTSLQFSCEKSNFDLVAKVLPCLTKSSVAEALNNCASNIPGTQEGLDLCPVMTSYIDCAMTAVWGECTTQQVLDVEAVFAAVYHPYGNWFCSAYPDNDGDGFPDVPSSNDAWKSFVNSVTPAPTVAVTALPELPLTDDTSGSGGGPDAVLQCYDCHSGAPNDWQNVECPASGVLTGWARKQFTNCAGYCLSVITRYPGGDVIRGCSNGYWFGDVDVPADGCINYHESVYCFCSSNLCNNQDMTDRVNAYMEKIKDQ